ETLKNAFRVYDNIAKQTRYLKAGEVNNLFGLISPNDGLLPFQMRLPFIGPDISDWKIRKLDDTIAYDLNSFIGTLKIYKTTEGNSYIVSNGQDVALSMTP